MLPITGLSTVIIYLHWTQIVCSIMPGSTSGTCASLTSSTTLRFCNEEVLKYLLYSSLSGTLTCIIFLWVPALSFPITFTTSHRFISIQWGLLAVLPACGNLQHKSFAKFLCFWRPCCVNLNCYWAQLIFPKMFWVIDINCCNCFICGHMSDRDFEKFWNT